MKVSALCQKRYSITSSARPSSESGTLRPRALAPLRLMIGAKAGFAAL